MSTSATSVHLPHTNPLLVYTHSWTCIQYLPGWLSHFEKCCVPTQPFEIRIAIANTLSQLLPVLKQLSPSNQAEQLLKLFCKLVVTVLQDSDSDVRLSMATEVAKLLPGTY